MIINHCPQHGFVEAHHLDDISPSAVCNNIIPRMDEIEYSTSSTIFLFSSPYYIMKNLAILDAILRWHAKKTLCLVAIDKAHLYAMHGCSFRVAMHILQCLLFNVVLRAGIRHTLLLGMTTHHYGFHPNFVSNLANIDWNAKTGNDPWGKKHPLQPHLGNAILPLV